MITKIVEQYADLPEFLRKGLWRIWHNVIIRSEREDAEVTFMNYGYVPLDGEGPDLELESSDEAERICINLYHHCASQVDLTGSDVLEVGSGRGGGASYVARYLAPQSVVGIDVSKAVIAFCNQHHRAVHNLKFVVGEAENIPFPDAHFDAVVNVESSRCYPDTARFFREVFRVLRPGGHLLLSDVRWEQDVETLREEIEAAGFEVEARSECSQNVVRALAQDSTRRRDLIRAKVPGPLVSAFDEFAGVEGTARYDSFASGKMQYWTYKAKKPSLD